MGLMYKVSGVLILIALTGFRYLTLTDLDIYRISTRRGYYPPVISRVFQNKAGESFLLARQQLFSLLSFDHLFRLFGYE